MLGLSFDDNGKYIGWSTLFDYSSDKAILESELLPAPQKTIYHKVNTGYDLINYLNFIKELTNIINQANKMLQLNPNDEVARNQLNEAQSKLNTSGLDLNSYLEEIINSSDNITRIRNYVKILRAINSIASNKEANIYYTIPEGREIVSKLQLHEFTTLPSLLLSSANKNFIASHIRYIISDLENMILAYLPVEMEDLRSASDLSPKGQSQSKITLLNPTTVMLLLYANITGKNVVGIAANGIKGSFMWYYYINDIIHHPYTKDFDKKLEYALFNFHTTRLIGRSTGTYKDIILNTLADINTEGVNPNIVTRLGTRLKSLIPVDNSGSLLVSAATDNAKELILAKINSGNKLAKMYSFLISLGVDLNDIVSFMTSDVASFIDAVTESDIFNDYNMNIKDAIQIARSGKIPTKYTKYKDKILSLYNHYSLNDESKNSDKLADINEFQNILQAADEFSNFARLLSLNQGIPVTKIDILNELSFILSIFDNRLNEYKEEHPSEEWLNDIEPFDSYKWLHDTNYREYIADTYNLIKKCLNVFDIFDSIPQFDAIREIFSAVTDFDSAIIIKSKVYDKLYNAAKALKLFMPKDYLNRLLSSIDDELISLFILQEHIKIPVKKGTTYLNKLYGTEKAKEDFLFEIKSKDDILAFKYIFENTIIPLLKNGTRWIYLNGQIIEEKDNLKLKSNSFIRALRLIKRNTKPLYAVDLNMLTIENSTDSLLKFLRYSKGLQDLSSIYFGNKSIADWFILYNLVVNKDAYGADRLTTLFDTFLKSRTNIDLLNKYYSYLGDLDYNSDVSLDIDPNQTGIVIGFENSLIAAAPIVSSTVGKLYPYIILNRGDGLELMVRRRGRYAPMGLLIERLKGETINDYLARINNFTNYNTLDINWSDKTRQLINSIMNLGDDAIARLNDFVEKGILLILKICK